MAGKTRLMFKDMIGTNIAENDFVAYPYGNRTLLVGKIVKFTPKMVLVRELGTRWERRLPHASVVKLNTDDVLLYSLTEGKT